MAGVPYVFGNATTSIPLTNLDANFNTGLTIGNTTVGLGNTVTTLGNVILTNATISSPSGIAANAVIYSTSTGNLTGNASIFTVDSNNNVGIGTTTPAVVGSSRKELTVKSTVADTYSILNLIGIRDVGGNQNGDVNFINSFGSQTITSRISGINGASSNTEGILSFQTKTSAGGLTEQLRINSTGALVLAGGTTTATGTGIAFPASQNNSSDANTLDDYEKGTWTPNQGSGLTVVGAFTSSGTYTKVGNLVTLYGKVNGATSIVCSGNGTLSNNLPFTSSASSLAIGGLINGAVTTSTNCYVAPSQAAAICAATTSTSANIYFSVTYQV